MEKEQNNVFYDNHIFTKEDIKKTIFSKWNWLLIWIYPTFVQVNEGYAFHYKIINGMYFILKVEKL